MRPRYSTGNATIHPKSYSASNLIQNGPKHFERYLRNPKALLTLLKTPQSSPYPAVPSRLQEATDRGIGHAPTLQAVACTDLAQALRAAGLLSGELHEAVRFGRIRGLR